MNDELFAELLESVREGGEIMQCKQQPSRTYEINAKLGAGSPQPARRGPHRVARGRANTTGQ
jgi:hypothetical protein